MRTRISARAIIIKGNKMAVIYRNKNGDEYMTTPGGGVEEGESVEEALRREIREEIGQEIVDHKFLFEEEWKGINCKYFVCQISGDKLVMNGPESKPNNGQIYKPMWIDIQDKKNLEMIRPEKVKEYVEFGKIDR